MKTRHLLLSLVCTVLPAAATSMHAQPCDPYWSRQFPSADLSSRVVVLTVFDDGSGRGPALYAGGDFGRASAVTVNRIARFDGDEWSRLGDGMNGAVSALAAFDDGSGPALYAGGVFSTAGEFDANHVARWDGKSWSPLGEGLDDNVYALAVFDDGSGNGPALYAAGWFTSAGGVPANHVAKWNGSTWEALGSGTDALAVSLAVFDDDSGGGPALYAGGFFTIAGGVEARHIAKWDGATWSPVGGGIDGYVQVLTVFGDGSGRGPALYVAGGFSAAGPVAANNIAKWDGNLWSPLASGVDDHVHTLAAFDDGGGRALYAGGLFQTAGNVGANHVAKWDGSAWSPLDSGTQDWVFALAEFDDGSGAGSALYTGGWFISAGEVETGYIAKWDGSSWSGLSSGVNDRVIALTVFDDQAGAGPDLYAGGKFSMAGGLAFHRIARWHDESWLPLGTGLDGDVYALAVFDDDSDTGPALYAGGYFSSAGGVEASNIAKWDGETWSPLSSGFDGLVYALAVFDDGSGSGPALYAGGASPMNIAKWDGTSWSPVGGGLADVTVRAMTVFDDGTGGGPALYAAGQAEGFYTLVAWIGKWDGTLWSPLDGLSNQGVILSLAVFDDRDGPDLYAGGQFCVTVGDDVGTCDLARWDGSDWSEVADGIDHPFPSPSVRALAVYDDGDGPTLFVAGHYTSIDGIPANNIASWNGSQWSALDGGIGEIDFDTGVLALAVLDDGTGEGAALFAGGKFTTAGGFSSQNIARWGGCAAFTFGDLTGDGVVDITDFGLLLMSWGPCPPPCPPTCTGDLDADCTVGIIDFLLLLANWT